MRPASARTSRSTGGGGRHPSAKPVARLGVEVDAQLTGLSVCRGEGHGWNTTVFICTAHTARPVSVTTSCGCRRPLLYDHGHRLGQVGAPFGGFSEKNCSPSMPSGNRSSDSRSVAVRLQERPRRHREQVLARARSLRDPRLGPEHARRAREPYPRGRRAVRERSGYALRRHSSTLAVGRDIRHPVNARGGQLAIQGDGERPASTTSSAMPAVCRPASVAVRGARGR